MKQAELSCDELAFLDSKAIRKAGIFFVSPGLLGPGMGAEVKLF
jgi:hypothetical protein